MADILDQFEIKDNIGSTVAFNGTATTSVQSVPALAGTSISDALIISSGRRLQVSFDGGGTFLNVPRNGAIAWNVKGQVAQLQVRTSSGTTDFDLLINFEDV
jgi:hypothetical protein